MLAQPWSYWTCEYSTSTEYPKPTKQQEQQQQEQQQQQQQQQQQVCTNHVGQILIIWVVKKRL